MIHCPKCSTVNASGQKTCSSCGMDLLPGASARDRLTTFFVGLIAGGVIFGIGYLLWRWKEPPDCLLASPVIWVIAGVFCVLAGFAGIFKKTPMHERYAMRSRRHVKLDPKQALEDISKAIELAPEKLRGALLQERIKLYEAMGASKEVVRDQISLANDPETYKTGSTITELLGGDGDVYARERENSEMKTLVSAEKARYVGYCVKCKRAVELNIDQRCLIHLHVKGKNVTIAPAEDLQPIMTKITLEYEKLNRRRTASCIILLMIPILALIVWLAAGILSK